MAASRLERRIRAARQFNRFYTRRIGALGAMLDSPFSLTEARVLYEVAHRPGGTARGIAAALGIDEGYLSRILRRFAARGLIARRASARDGREALLTLTARGRRTFAPLEARSNAQAASLFARLPGSDQQRLVDAMATIERLLDPSAAAPSATPYLLRPPQAGDLGWVVHRHGALYAQEYGYDEHFEALVATIVGTFVERFKPRRERCWIAEKDGEIAGSVFLVEKSARVAKLRLLLVEPWARGLGIGRRLVDECIRFAVQAGYQKITLWTQSELIAARRLYEASGFRLVHQHPHHSFSQDLVAETWDLDLRGPDRRSTLTSAASAAKIS